MKKINYTQQIDAPINYNTLCPVSFDLDLYPVSFKLDKKYNAYLVPNTRMVSEGTKATTHLNMTFMGVEFEHEGNVRILIFDSNKDSKKSDELSFDSDFVNTEASSENAALLQGSWIIVEAR